MKTGSGWNVRNQFCGGRGLGDIATIATVWDAEITAITETLKLSKGRRLLILSDSKAAITAVMKAGRMGQGRTRELSEATVLIARRCRNDRTAVCLSWVQNHIVIEGNEAADKKAKKAVEEQIAQERGRNITLITERGVRQKISAQRREERQQTGWEQERSQGGEGGRPHGTHT